MSEPLHVHDLRVSLGGIPILKGVSLDLQEREVVAILGGNGSGKTTLVRSVLGLIPHDHGSVKLFGTELDRFRQWHRLGYVPQRASLAMHSTTVKELVESGTLSRRKPFQPMSSQMRATVAEAIDRVGLSAKTKELFVHLSGGQQQRVLIARALVERPETLVMDEPFAGVDLVTQHQIAELLSQLHDDGLSMLVVLHETDVMSDLIDRAVVLADGRVASDGPLPASHGHAHEMEPPIRTSPILEGVQPWKR